MAKRFFFISAGLLCLAVTFHLGAVSGHAFLLPASPVNGKSYCSGCLPDLGTGS